MKVRGLDGYEHNLQLKNRERPNCSKGHLYARELLKDIFPSYMIYEEVTLPGSKINTATHPLYADFLIPNIKIVVEIHGEQHYTHSTFFHSSKSEFLKAKKRDQTKKAWCELNNFSFIELKHDEQDRWRETIIDGI